MSQETLHYCIHVERANGLPMVAPNAALPRRSSQDVPPSTYVKISIGDTSFKTKTIKRDANPVWDERFYLPVQDSTSSIVLQVKHTGSLRSSLLLGDVQTSVAELLRITKQNSSSVELGLSQILGNQSQGCLKIGLWPQESDAAAKHAISEAQQATISSGMTSTAAVGDSLQAAQDAISGPTARMTQLATVVGKLELFMDIAQSVAKIHPYIYVAWKVVSAVYDTVKVQLERDKKVVDLVTTMESVYSFVEVVRSHPDKLEALENIIESILDQTIECVIFIREYAGRGFSKRLLHGSSDGGMIDTLSQAFKDLKQSFDSGVAVQTTVVTFRIQGTVETILRDIDLQKLNPAGMDAAHRQECLPDTRLDIIESVADWVMEPSGEQNVLWLHGLAGSGKSTLATTLAQFFGQLGRLGAFLFFDRDVKERNDPLTVVKTLAFQLAEFDSRIWQAVADAIRKFQSTLRSSLALQFENFLNKPLASSSLEGLHSSGPIVVILDGLDECGNAESRTRLLEVLRNQLPKLPPCYRFIITSRTESDIRDVLSVSEHVDERELDISSTSNNNDIQVYIRHQMSSIRGYRKHLSFPLGWPGENKLCALADRAAGLFVWASTATKFIRSGQDPEQRLNILIKADVAPEAERALNGLYQTALQTAGNWDDPSFALEFRAVVGMILAAKNPLSSDAIDKLRGPEAQWPSLDKISNLGSVLTLPPHPIRILHFSFADFLSDLNRCGDERWYIDVASHNYYLAKQCLDCLGRLLPITYAEPSLSWGTVNVTLPEEVSYACIFWPDHVYAVVDDEHRVSIAEHFENFLHKHFLHWLEALSILKRSREATRMLGRLLQWVSSFQNQQGLHDFVHDAYRFTQTFAESIEQHPFLVYRSALPFTPTSSSVYRTFYDSDKYPWIAGGFQASRSPLLLVISGHTDSVTSVAFSPDGTIVASSSDDALIRMWDAETGLEVTTLRGHQGSIQSIAFTDNGMRIISGSHDKTVRTWEVTTGKEILSLRRACNSSVLSIACSSDGRLIACGSADETLLVWKIEDETADHVPFLRLDGHSSSILSVAFSPDSSRIASASADQTIRLWDIKTGQMDLHSPIEGHIDSVLSVAFSPNGSRVVSCSEDESIAVWDAQTGSKLVSVLGSADSKMGHNEPVSSVAFSPDGKYIISGSEDKTIRLWSAETGEGMWASPRRHDKWVTSVSFSSDGSRIISGSGDGTIRVWDASPGLKSHNREPVRGVEKQLWAIAFSPSGTQIASGVTSDNTINVWDPQTTTALVQLRGHTEPVESIVFSPDEERILSGSQDRTIRLWDAASGLTLLNPIQGHDGSVLSVDFSPGDGRWIASGSEDKTVRIWSASLGTNIFVLRGHEQPITSVVFSPSGLQIASGSDDGTIRVWDRNSGVQVLTLPRVADAHVLSVAYSSEGQRILSASGDGTLRVWDTTSLECVIASNYHRGVKQNVRNPLLIRSDGWIEDVARKKMVSHLPPIMSVASVVASASSSATIALATLTGDLYFLHFPSEL